MERADGSTVQDMKIGGDGGGAADMTEVEVRPNLVLVRKGSFQMGSPPAESGRGSDEGQHTVTLTTDIWMAETEVTQRQYRNLMGSSPSSFEGDDLPVELVSWFDAVAYCNALSVKEKLQPCYQISGMTVGWADGVRCTGYRLPTEAEWEYAANPLTPPRTVYTGSDTVDGVAWYSANSMNTTHAVKTRARCGAQLRPAYESQRWSRYSCGEVRPLAVFTLTPCKHE
jgi:formylglycine-generating enzyme required for sulfatase activity